MRENSGPAETAEKHVRDIRRTDKVGTRFDEKFEFIEMSEFRTKQTRPFN